jgi:hypothetical protein
MEMIILEKEIKTHFLCEDEILRGKRTSVCPV